MTGWVVDREAGERGCHGNSTAGEKTVLTADGTGARDLQGFCSVMVLAVAALLRRGRTEPS